MHWSLNGENCHLVHFVFKTLLCLAFANFSRLTAVCYKDEVLCCFVKLCRIARPQIPLLKVAHSRDVLHSHPGLVCTNWESSFMTVRSEYECLRSQHGLNVRSIRLHQSGFHQLCCSDKSYEVLLSRLCLHFVLGALCLSSVPAGW